ncbi:MAG: diguanylate cyclase [Minwuia sp.]|uniref:sensor domain-containing diguanylate cyclase n=1 Tax=Minwuia sp. TaxID=2493630 RepID=UPI003A8659EB
MPLQSIVGRLGEAKFFDALVASTESIVVVTDASGRIAMVNDAFENRLGYSGRDVIGRPIWAFRALDDIAAARENFNSARGPQVMRREPSLWRRKDGGDLLLAWSIQILHDDDGNEVARIGTAIDLTEARQAEGRARAAERRQRIFEQITANLTEPLFFIEPDGTIAFASDAVRRVYGYEPHELVGRSSAILRPDDRVEIMAEHLEKMRETGKARKIETEAIHKDGHRIPVELRTAPVFDENGEYAGVSAVVYDMKDRYETEQELRRLAGTDPLTGVSNRLGFTTFAEREVKRARRYQHDLSVIVADIDHFKAVNDTYGHAAGDAALVRFADVMGWSLRRPVDHLARTGGEEFVAILPETGAKGSLTAAERIRASVEMNIVRYGDTEFRLTASFGVSSWQPDEEDLGAAVDRADEALYEAKNSGRNRVVYMGPEGQMLRRMAG